MLNESHVRRLPFIDEVLRQFYDEEEISSSLFEEFSTEDAVVWVDPLDGTNEFTRNNMSAVTVLIGLAIKDKSKLGIVHKPHADSDSSKGETFFGSGEHGTFKLMYDRSLS